MLRFLLVFIWLCVAVIPATAQTIVDIDVKPGGDNNPINYKSKGKTPVAILGSADVSVTDIDPATVSLCASDAATPCGPNAQHCALEDVNEDGFVDLVCHVPTQRLQVVCGQTTGLTLTATSASLGAVEGSDAIVIVPPKCR